MTTSLFRRLAIVLLFLLLVVSCRGVDDNGGGEQGELTLGITDGPVDGADEVRVVFSGIEIVPATGPSVMVDELDEEFIDFLKLEGGERELLLSNFDLDDGTYQAIRLIFNPVGSFVKVNGAEYELIVPAAEEPNLTIDVSLFFDPDNDEEDVTIDLDLRKSLRIDETVSPPVYELHPRMRVIDTDRGEILRGTVERDLVEDTSCNNDDEDGNAVYLFVGNSGDDDRDIRDESGDPFATAAVKFNNTSKEWEFAFGFLPRQAYRLFFTCDAISDDPEVDNSAEMDFKGPVTIDVQQGNTETVRFESGS